MEKALKTKKKVKSAMVYPIVVVGVAVAIVALLMVVVVPKFQTIFDDMLEGPAVQDIWLLDPSADQEGAERRKRVVEYRLPSAGGQALVRRRPDV